MRSEPNYNDAAGMHWTACAGDGPYRDWDEARVLLWPDGPPRPRPTPEMAAAADAIVAGVPEEQLASFCVLAYGASRPAERPIVEARVAAVARTAEQLRRRIFPRVLAVADALLNQKTLTYSQAAAIYRATPLPTVKGV
jgi:hypothetical protein